MNKKDYKGYELIKAIHDGEIKDGTKIEVHDERLNESLVTILEYKDYRLNWKEGSFNTRALFDDYYYFKILEDNTEEIEELDEEWTYIEGQIEKTWSKSELELVNKINEIIRYIKRKESEEI